MIESLEDIQIEDDVERIFLLRKRLKLSQFQFAKAIGVSTSYLGQIERGELVINSSFIDKINSYLKREQELYEKDIFSNF